MSCKAIYFGSKMITKLTINDTTAIVTNTEYLYTVLLYKVSYVSGITLYKINYHI